MKYVDEFGEAVASYVYDDFGAVVSHAGDLADSFAFGFSTKYLDHETGLVAYQLRFYNSSSFVWCNHDPLDESASENLYAFCFNHPIANWDLLGMATAIRWEIVIPEK